VIWMTRNVAQTQLMPAQMMGDLDDTKRSANAVNACVNNDARQCKWGIVV